MNLTNCNRGELLKNTGSQKRVYFSNTFFEVSEDEIRRLLAEPVHEWRFFHSDFAQFSFSPRSIGNSQTYEQAALSMFQVRNIVRVFYTSN